MGEPEASADFSPHWHRSWPRARSPWDAYWDNQARRATVLMLEALDDRMLKDIGLARSEIWPAVLGNDPARPHPYDPHWRTPSVS